MIARGLPVVLATGAVAWSVALIPAAFWLPVYSVDSSSGASGLAEDVSGAGSATLVGVNGMGPVVIFGVLCAIAVIGWIGLHARCAHGSRVGTVVGWTCGGMVLAFSGVAFSVGLMTLPIAVLLLAAAGLTPAGGRATA